MEATTCELNPGKSPDTIAATEKGIHENGNVLKLKISTKRQKAQQEIGMASKLTHELPY